MITVKAPEHYWNESGSLRNSGAKLRPLGNLAFIIGGHKAWERVELELTSVLQAEGIAYSYHLFTGHCTQHAIDRLASEAANLGAAFVIGIGGGSALDTAKAVAEQAGLVVVTIPTIAATCAAWSALSVLYDDDGRSAGYLPLRQSPKFILSDPDILTAAPARYLASGLADTIVKWYETAIHIAQGEFGSLDARIGVRTSELALDIIRKHGLAVYEAVQRGESHPAAADVTDAIISLAGLVGSVSGEGGRGGFAHIIHDSLTWVPGTHHSLHGEKVGFGLIAQLFLEGKREEADTLAAFLNRFSLPITLSQLGIEGDSEQIAEAVADRIKLPEAFLNKLSFPVNKTLLVEAVIEADRAGSQIIQANLVIHSN